MWLWIQHETDLLARPQRLLHIAPEPVFQQRLRVMPHLDYVATDLVAGRYKHMDVAADLTRFDFADNTFDAIICSHVLEHIPDDCAAMRELQRVLHPGGWCLIDVPSFKKQTIEDIHAPLEERIRRFGHPEHVRLYGPDIAERLRSSGFTVEIIRSDIYVFEQTAYQWSTLGLLPQNIYICH
jgi:ubiquinone/menaquinone biosynthesis C-methylase UbiE